MSLIRSMLPEMENNKAVTTSFLGCFSLFCEVVVLFWIISAANYSINNAGSVDFIRKICEW